MKQARVEHGCLCVAKSLCVLWQKKHPVLLVHVCVGVRLRE